MFLNIKLCLTVKVRFFTVLLIFLNFKNSFLISSFFSSVFPPLFVKHFTNLITVNCGSSEEVRLPDSGRLETFTILKSIWLNWKYLVFLNKSDEVVLICQQEAGARSRKSGRPPRMQQLTHTSSNPKEWQTKTRLFPARSHFFPFHFCTFFSLFLREKEKKNNEKADKKEQTRFWLWRKYLVSSSGNNYARPV